MARVRENAALKPVIINAKEQGIINAKEQGSFVMTLRKLQRRRSAFRELLQSLDTGGVAERRRRAQSVG